MKLYLVQHGQASAKEIDGERPLTEFGIADVTRLARFLKQAGIKVDRVLHSGKLRAAQTAELLGAAVAPGTELEISGLLNPNDNPKAFDWQSESWNVDTLIVGHLPFMAKLVSHLLVADESRQIVAYQPGSMVCLEHVNNSRWQMNWMIRPELLQETTT